MWFAGIGREELEVRFNRLPGFAAPCPLTDARYQHPCELGHPLAIATAPKLERT
jgi:hypothetical protein